MKKNSKNTGLFYSVFQTHLKLKLTALLILVAMFNIRGNTYAQKTKVTLELNNSTIEKVIETIEQKTDFRFIYKLNDIDLERVITISVKNQPIDVVLNKLFKGTPTEFKVRDTQIILKKPELKTETIRYEKFTVSGIITDENGMPLAGASVIEEGTKNGMVTDFDGKYSLNVESNASVIVVTFIGYKEKKVIATQKNINIQLFPDATDLKEIVVVGYSSVAKKDVTGAVSSINAKDMNQGVITNPLQLISGKAAGVNITQVGSEPGSTPSIRIRGIGSLIGGNDPLVVVDGIQGNMDLLNQIPPSEIENIDILKDASATAVYGSRGAPGVLIVTTKKSKAGKTTVEYNGTISIDFIPKKLDMLSADEWWTAAQKYDVPASANHGSNTDWYGLLTQTGMSQTHTLSFGGGTDKFSYRASITAILQEGVVINSDNRKYIGRIQATQKALDDKLKLTFNLNNGIFSGNNSIADIGSVEYSSNLITNAYLMRPTDPVFNTDGSYYTDPNVFQYFNPYAAAQTVTNERQEDNLFGSLKADLDLFKGFTASWFGSWRKTSATSGYYLPAASTNAYAMQQNGYADINNNRQNEKLTNASLSYKEKFGIHSINALALYEWQNQTYQGSYARAKGFINDKTTYNQLLFGDVSKVAAGDLTSYKNDRTLVSFLGQINYSLLDRYLVTASYRRDGSSVFGANNKWGDFPSAAVAWQINKESFMQNQSLFNELKLRAGYGITGNQQGLQPLGSIALVGPRGLVNFGGETINYYGPSQNANPNLKWETKKQTNIGLDFALLDNRLRGTIDAYTATTDDLLFGYTISQQAHDYNYITANLGSILNKGLEFSLGYDVIRTDNSTLTLAGNLSFMKNEVLNLSGTFEGENLPTDYVVWGAPNSFLVKGKPAGAFYITESIGVDSNGGEIVKDRDGSGGAIDQGAKSADRYYAGSALPTYTFGFSPSYRYKNLDVSLLLKGSGGNKIYNALGQNLSTLDNIGSSNVLKSSLDKGVRTTNYASDLWLEDGSFIRLENITAGYNLRFTDKYIESIRFSLTGNNLFLITDYSGMDPEININGSGDRSFGNDRGYYPRTRSVAFGLSVKFK
jgi:TonB-dependent starch-binding outer membrane protein SusC